MKIGDLILLRIKEEEQEVDYRTKVINIKDDILYIDIPIHILTLKSGNISKGMRIEVHYVKVNGSISSFDSKVIDIVEEQNTIHIEFPPITEHNTIDKRPFAKLDVPVDIAIHSSKIFFQPFVTCTTEINANGASFLIPKDINVKANFEIIAWIILFYKSGESKFFKFKSKVIKVIEREEHSEDMIIIEFMNISKNDLQALIRFCFEKQLELRDKLIYA
ncbi:flagellar brake protein [Bacillus sp. JJ722]|uniref:flagellar brake protein n=1 Tax=Bacillus sp. JJ722 TaxID=3122973 RepID=UPI002FFE33E5